MVTTRSTRSSARSRSSSGSSPTRRSSGSRSRSTSRSSARRTIPWLKEHPDWFHRRPDGTLKYAENPPKKYQDIYNVNFDSPDWKNLWQALRDVVLLWVSRGVTVFRVDNPHTKPVAFWEWLIDEVRRENPEVFFLAEAFTRPAMMTTLAKVGFAQSYTYFTWKNTRWELARVPRRSCSSGRRATGRTAS